MAPPGRPTDPPDRRRPGSAGNPDPDDWDWGDEDAWDDSTVRPRTGAHRAATQRTAVPSGHHGDHDDLADVRHGEPTAVLPRTDAVPAREDVPRSAGGGGHRPPGTGARPTVGGVPGPSPSRAAAIVRRRRLLAVGGSLIVLLVAILVISSIASGGEDDRTASVPLLAGPLEAAATASTEHIDRVDAVRRFAEMGEPIYCGAGKKPWVALTYDDGPGRLSPAFIKLLSDEKIPVTSFRVGTAVPGNERYIVAQRNLGWESGTHTQNHPQLTALSEAEQRREIVAGNDASARVLGRKPTLFRPPYQAHDRTTDRIVEELGQVQVLWNVDTADSLGPTTADKVARNAIEGLRPGSIILMHETKENTLKAMPKIIAAMRERNLQPVTVSQMLAGDPPSEQQVKNGYAGCLTQEASSPGEGGAAAS